MLLSASLLVAFATMQPGAHDWRELSDGPEANLAWDAAGITREGALTAVPLRIVPKPARQGLNAYAIARVEIRCAGNEGRVALTQNYASDGAPGERDVSDLPFLPIPEQSFLSALRDLVCGGPAAPSPRS